MIQSYTKYCNPELWFGQFKTQQESLRFSRLLSIYTKQCTQLKNKIHGEHVLGIPSKSVERSLKRQLKKLKQEIKRLEEKRCKNVKLEYQDSLTLLKTIPGIGEKTALMLLAFTDGFNLIDLRVQKDSVAMQELLQ